MNINKLMLDANDKQGNEYKEGWNDAICYLNDNFCITTRKGEPIQISFELSIDENKMKDKIKEAKDAE